MMTIEFTIRGKPVPFIAHWDKAAPATRKRYIEWCKTVQNYAMVAGFRFEPPTERSPLYAHTRAWFPDRRHGDPENIHKSVVDALFYRKGEGSKGDKYTGGFFDAPRYDAHNPRVQVVIVPASQRISVRSTIPAGWLCL